MARETTPTTHVGLEVPDRTARRASTLFLKEVPDKIEPDGLEKDFQQRTDVYMEEGLLYMTEEGLEVPITKETLVEQVQNDPDGTFVEAAFRAMAEGMVARSAVQDYQRYIDKTQKRVEEMTPQIERLVTRRHETEQQLADTERELLQAYREARDGTRQSRESTPGPEGARKRKALDHPKRLGNGKDPSFDFWKAAMKHKLEKDRDDYPTAEDRASYIMSRCEGSAAQQLEPYLRKGTYEKDPEGLLELLKDLFHDPLRREKAEAEFYRLYMKKNQSFAEFYAQFVQLAADAEIEPTALKRELSKRVTDDLKKATARESSDPTVEYHDLKRTIERISFVDESINQRTRKQKDPKETKREEKNPPAAVKKSPAAVNREADKPRDDRIQRLSREGKCFNCEGTGHLSRDCPMPRKAMTAAVQPSTGSARDEKKARKRVRFEEKSSSSGSDSEKE